MQNEKKVQELLDPNNSKKWTVNEGYTMSRVLTGLGQGDEQAAADFVVSTIQDFVHEKQNEMGLHMLKPDGVTVVMEAVVWSHPDSRGNIPLIILNAIRDREQTYAGKQLQWRGKNDLALLTTLFATVDTVTGENPSVESRQAANYDTAIFQLLETAIKERLFNLSSLVGSRSDFSSHFKSYLEKAAEMARKDESERYIRMQLLMALFYPITLCGEHWGMQIPTLPPLREGSLEELLCDELRFKWCSAVMSRTGHLASILGSNATEPGLLRRQLWR